MAQNRSALEAITKIRETYLAGVNASDIEPVMALYADDAVRMPPNEPPVIGKAAIRAWYAAGWAVLTIEESFEPADVRIGQEFVIERGTARYTLRFKDGSPSISDEVSYVWVYQRQQDDSWKLFQAIWNSNIRIQ